MEDFQLKHIESGFCLWVRLLAIQKSGPILLLQCPANRVS